MIFLLTIACGPKQPVEAPPLVGWHQEETWSLGCYHPPEYEKLTETDRLAEREKAMDQMMLQWKGQRADGVQFDEKAIDGIELVMLSQPEKTERISRENLEKCKQAATGAISTADWASWGSGLPAQLTAGECNTHFMDTVFDYFEIEMDYQHTFPICKDDKIRVAGSVKDQYRIADDGPWINVEGDQNSPSLGKENLPCNIENCFDGMLIMKFTDEDGRETVYPVGAELLFTAPANGVITYGINDDTFYDNIWYQSGGLQDHASVEIAPRSEE